MEYKHNHHSVGISMYHLEWCTKYRYKMFAKYEYKNLCTACIRQAATKYNIKIVEISVMPEHIHIVIELRMNMSLSKALQLLKGYSAKLFFGKLPQARLRYPRGHLWSRGKFASSLGFVQLDVAKEYVRNQEIKHMV